ncbi:MAG: c-type cytochrome [Rhodopseudomonas sp.]|nr:c-type cytochrome [Rhodopseudomonas sp.]
MAAALALAGVLAGSGVRAENTTGQPDSGLAMTRAQAYARAAKLEALGRKMFADPGLSGSGKLACASCHDPQHGFAPGNDRAVQLGGKDLTQAGFRATPSLKYLQAAPQFTEHYYESEDEADASIDNGPSGGLTWDGRADRAREQARFPLLAPFEMANDSEAAVAARLRKASYAGDITAIFGPAVWQDDAKTFAAATEALEVYQQNAAEFYPYTSKYDFYLAGRTKLTPQEARGLALFNDPDKGNCGNCHRSEPADDGTPPQFTDFGMIAIGVPRNRAIPANADPRFFDLGLCGPLRTDFAGRTDYCGLFRTPSLRNVALRRNFFHNGVIKTLRQAVTFYVERDTAPAKWYPRKADGTVDQYDDLPARYRDNLNTEPPFGGKPGDKPALSSAEIDDVVAFLNTLTDGYKPQP